MSEDLIAEAIEEAFGPRCLETVPGCHCCDAWSQYDSLVARAEAAAEIERLRAKLAEAEENPRDNEEADQRLMEFLVQAIGGHSVTIVREGKRLIGWCAGGKGRSIAMADLRAAAEWMEKGDE
ncbi:MAG: hypothetical protein VYB05_07610 [Pseudomonadota bacterium]|nr:hypothetical protein [Pseudomonadota bacterium]